MDRLKKRPEGLLVYKLKKPNHDGTQFLLFSPEELLEKLVALVPIPRAHLIRYHGCLAPHSRIRSKVLPRTLLREFKDGKSIRSRRRMRWAQLLKRVFKVDLENCHRCGGRLKVIAAILDATTIGKILAPSRAEDIQAP